MTLSRLVTVLGVAYVVGRLALRLYEKRDALQQAQGIGEIANVVEPALKEAAQGI